jgi:DNA-binding FadR family transcriptional regulator
MTMDAISDLPMPDDIDADYSPQYVKLARIIRAKIEAGQYIHGQRIPAASLMSEHKVSRQVTYATLAMLAANRYVTKQASFKPYQVTWDAARSHNKTSVNKIKPPASGNIRASDPRQ